jgi:hypothetical protein
MTSLSGYISTWVCVLRALLDRSRWTSVLTTASLRAVSGYSQMSSQPAPTITARR